MHFCKVKQQKISSDCIIPHKMRSAVVTIFLYIDKSKRFKHFSLVLLMLITYVCPPFVRSAIFQ